MNELLGQLSEIVDLAKEHYKLEFCKAPLRKNVLTILGDQSSGKSSFINHLFGQSIRQTGQNAIDTQFTIIETVSEEEFKELCPQYDANVTFTRQELSEPIERTKTDKRKNSVWCELKQIQKMHRYKQFYESNLRDVFVKYNDLVCAMIINERWVIGTQNEQNIKRKMEEDAKLAKDKIELEKKSRPVQKVPIIKMDDSVQTIDYRDMQKEEILAYIHDFDEEKKFEYHLIVLNLIIIDTPGFNDETVSDVHKFKSNIDVLEFFFSQSSLLLFLVSPDHLLTGCSLHMLQLTLLDPDTKKVIIQKSKDLLSDKGNNSSLIDAMLSGACTKLSIHIDDMIDYKIKGLMSKGYETDSSIKHQFFGAAMYEKVYFVINKIGMHKSVI